jgi:hypothetical protein
MKNTEHSAKNIRIFLILLTVVSALLLWGSFKGIAGLLKMKIFIAVAAITLFFIIFPRLFAPVYKVILKASGVVGNVIFLIIATTVFFALLTPLSLIMRMFGKKFMAARYDQSALSYFESPHVAQGYEKQY